MRRERKLGLVVFSLILVFTGIGIGFYNCQLQGKQLLVISTTTSLFDTGLLDIVKSEYGEANRHVVLGFISAGTGIAITHAKNGDADAILVHSPSQEELFMQDGFGVNRKIIAYNFFVIVGPQSDPAGIEGMNVTSALNQIYNHGRTQNTNLWVSRDDSSGTNSKETALWSLLGLDYDALKEQDWFISSGSGMGSTLQVADELGLYTLSDIGTYLKFHSDGLITLEKFVDTDEALVNVYSAIAVNSTKVGGVKFDLAMEFIQWLVGTDAQELIGDFGLSGHGQSLFKPAAAVVQTQTPTDVFGWIRDNAFYDAEGTLYECPPEWRRGDYGLYNN